MTQKIAYKTEIALTSAQMQKLKQTIGGLSFHLQSVCGSQPVSTCSRATFSKYLNNQYRTEHPEHHWITQVSSKAVKQSIMDAELAFKSFFKGQSGFPKFKKKAQQKVKAYFPMNSPTDIQVNRHRIKLPTIGCFHLSTGI